MTSEETQAALEPCPFCGGMAAEETSKGPTGERYRWVQCEKCGAMSECCDDSARANNPDEPEPVLLWNTRLTAQSGEDLFHAIKHGDDEHRAWLKDAIEAFFAGRSVPPPRGEGKKDAEIKRLTALLKAQSGEGRSGAGEDWISHDGGDCPVDPAATVEIKLRDGSVTTMAAKAVNWRYGAYIFEARRTMPASCEVVAYRIAALNARQSGEGERLREALELAKIKLRRYMDVHGPNGLNPDTYVGGYQAEIEAVLTTIAAALRATDDAGGRP